MWLYIYLSICICTYIQEHRSESFDIGIDDFPGWKCTPIFNVFQKHLLLLIFSYPVLLFHLLSLMMFGGYTMHFHFLNNERLKWDLGLRTFVGVACETFNCDFCVEWNLISNRREHMKKCCTSQWNLSLNESDSHRFYEYIRQFIF